MIDDKIQFTVEKSLTGDMNVIQSVNKYSLIISFISRVSKQSLVGSILCGLNEQNVLHAPLKAINRVLKSVSYCSFCNPKRQLPVVLLLASPIHPRLITSESVSELMDTYCKDLIAGKKAIENNKQAADPFKQLVQLPEVEVEPEPTEGLDEQGAEWYVEKLEEGVDHYMFPRSMGYLVLENQYKV